MNSFIKDKSIVFFGFGSQGRAQAMNLQDSGYKITICLPETSSNIVEAKSAGFEVVTNAVEAAKEAEIAAFMVPDSVQKKLYNEIADHLPLNSSLIFAHGLNIHYELIIPREDIDVILVAPLSHGDTVRTIYLEKSGLPVMIAIKQNVTGSAWQAAKEFATAIGATENKIIETSFKEETETDLFTEQSLICGGIWKLVTTAFETLIEEGYKPEIAYYCCLKEFSILSNLFSKFGFFEAFNKISDTARFGALSRGPKVITKEVKEQMKSVLSEIKDGTFISELSEELKDNKKTTEMMKVVREHPLELVHKKLSKN